MTKAASAHPARIDQFFAGLGARSDQWETLVELAEAWSKGSDKPAGLEAALAELAATEEYHAYPGMQLMTALREHLDGQQPRLDLPLDVRATAFQMKVWQYLQSIPYGSVESYAEVAAGLGQPTAARAVARACSQNRVALAIPCHRVIRGTGELGGYRWGLERKRTLIDLERRTVSRH